MYLNNDAKRNSLKRNLACFFAKTFQAYVATLKVVKAKDSN